MCSLSENQLEKIYADMAGITEAPSVRIASHKWHGQEYVEVDETAPGGKYVMRLVRDVKAAARDMRKRKWDAEEDFSAMLGDLKAKYGTGGVR